MPHKMRAAANAEYNEPRALERTSKPAAVNGWEFFAHVLPYAAGEENVVETALARSQGGIGSHVRSKLQRAKRSLRARLRKIPYYDAATLGRRGD